MIAGICTYSYADEIVSAVNGMQYGTSNNVNTMKSMASKILGLVQAVGYAISIIVLSIYGIKYMYAATAEKAKIKEQLIPYVIGAIILFGASFIISVINRFSQLI